MSEPKPYCWVIPGDDQADMNGWISARVDQWGEFTKPVYDQSAIAALEARCVAAEQAEANAFRNRDSAVAENEKFRAMLEKIEGSSRPRGEPAWQYDEIRALLGMPTASETPVEWNGSYCPDGLGKCDQGCKVNCVKAIARDSETKGDADVHG